MAMKSIFVVVALFAYIVSASDVLDLTESNFDTEVQRHEIVLVEFYAPWCGHCKRLAPEYEKAATALKSNDPPVPLAKVDCPANNDLCSKHGVSGYPTLKIFKNGEVSSDYNGPRDADGIAKYMRSKAGPSSKLLSSVADADKLIGGFDLVVVGFFTEGSNTLMDEFLKAADGLSEEFRFAHTQTAALLDHFGHRDEIVLFRPKRLQSMFEPKLVKFEGMIPRNTRGGGGRSAVKMKNQKSAASSFKIKSFVSDNANGLCGQRTGSNSDQFKTPLITAYYDVDYVKNVKGTNYWRNRVMKVAKKLKDEGLSATFAVANKNDFSHEMEEFGLTAAGDKPVIAAKNDKDQKFVMSGDFDMAAFETFVRDFLAGNLEPYLKSEPLPADGNAGPLKVAVGKNFDEVVNDPERDVLIEFYAPWCGHCKSLAPKYEELAEKLKDEPGVTIAKMDATANDVPSTYGVRGFPTLFFAPKGSKSSPKKYEGGREVDDFIKYIAKEATDELVGFDRSGKAKKKIEL